MLDAVFISDLHLNPTEPQLIAKFNAFIDWAITRTHCLYILGDLFHVWAGDDCVEPWSLAIAEQFQRLKKKGIRIYFMPGNRDFLLGAHYAKQAGFDLLPDPSVIALRDQAIVLAHGDAYCLSDKKHQRFRKLTRKAMFKTLFLKIPRKLRQYLVQKVRLRSQAQHHGFKSAWIVDVEPKAIMQSLQSHQAKIIIHGHTHQPGLTLHHENDAVYQHYVLSDWDDKPHVLIYNKSSGFEFAQPV